MSQSKHVSGGVLLGLAVVLLVGAVVVAMMTVSPPGTDAWTWERTVTVVPAWIVVGLSAVCAGLAGFRGHVALRVLAWAMLGVIFYFALILTLPLAQA